MTQPTPANDFLVTNDTPLDPTTLTAVFQALWFRIRDLQEIAVGFENAVSQSAIELANGKLDLAVAPALNALNRRVNEITALMADAEDRLAALQNGGVAAENVPVGPIEGFPANTNAAQAFALTINAIISIGETLQSVDQTLADMAPTLSGAQQRSQKGQANGYPGLDAAGKIPVAQVPAGVGAFEAKMLHVNEQQAQGVGSASEYLNSNVAAGFKKAALNNVTKNQITGASLSATVITLPAGTYLVDATLSYGIGGANNAPFAPMLRTQAGVNLVRGQNSTAYGGQYSGQGMTPTLRGFFTLAAATQVVVGIIHGATNSGSQVNTMPPMGQGPEVYHDVAIWKVA